MIRDSLNKFGTVAAALLAMFLPQLPPDAIEGVVPRYRKPTRGQRWVKTSEVVDHAYHRQPPTKSATGPKPSPRRMVNIYREVHIDGSRYPEPNKLINTPKHLRRAAA